MLTAPMRSPLSYFSLPVFRSSAACRPPSILRMMNVVHSAGWGSVSPECMGIYSIGRDSQPQGACRGPQPTTARAIVACCGALQGGQAVRISGRVRDDGTASGKVHA